jgi:hypothetical protein
VDWNEGIDHLYIDGKHTYQQVFSELKKFEPFVRKGGIITLHDFVEFDVRNAIYDFLKDRNDLKLYKYYNNNGLAVIFK